MTRLLLCAALLLACVAVVVAANNTTNTSTSLPTPTPTPTMSLAPTPTPTATPIVPAEPDNYVLYNNKSVCLRMSGGMSMSFNFTNGTRKVNGTDEPTYNTTVLPVSANISKSSFCHNDPSNKKNEARLILTWNNNSYTLQFDFMEDVTNKNWSLNTVNFTFSVDGNKFFNNYTYQSNYTHLMAANTTPIFDGVDLGSSYRCNAQQKYVLNVTDGTTYIKTMMVDFDTKNWRVQAFSFKKNATNGTYDNPKLCDADAESRSKVVPIAVGCALAGLVIIVLVAYLIGRFRSRKHESYETLS